jgi:hypothetical protein
MQLFFWGVALLALYLLGFRGLQLFGAALAGGFVLTVLLAGPLDRVLPPPLESYRPPPWREPKFVTLFPDETTQSDSVKDSGGQQD